MRKPGRSARAHWRGMPRARAIPAHPQRSAVRRAATADRDGKEQGLRQTRHDRTGPARHEESRHAATAARAVGHQGRVETFSHDGTKKVATKNTKVTKETPKTLRELRGLRGLRG